MTDEESVPDLQEEDFAALLAFRTGLRRYLRWSEDQARAVGLTPAQHQLLLAIRGHGGSSGPAVGDIADYLLLRHHSAVELIDRAESAGLVRRVRDADDGRVIRVATTATGDQMLGELTRHHLAELQHLAPVLARLTTELADLREQTAPQPE